MACGRYGGRRAGGTQAVRRRSLLSAVGVTGVVVVVVVVRSSVRSAAHGQHTARSRARARLHAHAQLRGDEAGARRAADEARRAARWPRTTRVRRLLPRPQERRRPAGARLHDDEGRLLSTAGDLLLKRGVCFHTQGTYAVRNIRISADSLR